MEKIRIEKNFACRNSTRNFYVTKIGKKPYENHDVDKPWSIGIDSTCYLLYLILLSKIVHFLKIYVLGTLGTTLASMPMFLVLKNIDF